MDRKVAVLGVGVGAMVLAGCASSAADSGQHDAPGPAPYDAGGAYQGWADQIQSASLAEQKPVLAGDYQKFIGHQLKSNKAAKKWGDGKDSKATKGSPFTLVIRDPGTLVVDQASNQLWVGDGTGMKRLPKKKTWWSRATVKNYRFAQVFDIQPDGSLQLVTMLPTKKSVHVGAPVDSSATTPKYTANQIAGAMDTALDGGKAPKWIKGSKKMIRQWQNEQTRDNGIVDTTDVWELEVAAGTWTTTDGDHIVITTNQRFETMTYPGGWVNSLTDWPLKPGAYRHIERTDRTHSFWLVPPEGSDKRVKHLGGLTVGSVDTTGERIGPVNN